MERQTVHFPSVPTLLRQLRAFQHRKMSSGRWRVEAPPGEHDDEVFALSLALTACADSPSILGYKPRGHSFRYVPTQEEAASGGLRSRAQQKRRKASIARQAARDKELGVI